MTSKSSFSSLLKEDIKSKMWMVLMNTVIMFFNFAVVISVQIQRVNVYIKEGSYTKEEISDILAYYIGGQNRITIFLTLLMACVGAFSQFGYLYQKTQVDFYHSLPIRRQKRFMVRFTNGVLIYIVPYLVFCLSALGIISAFGYGNMEIVKAAFLGILINVLGYVLCFTTAILAVCLTGNLFAGICGMLTLFGYGYLVTELANLLMTMDSKTYMEGYGNIEKLYSVLSPLGIYDKLSHVANGKDAGNTVCWLMGSMFVLIILLIIALWTYIKRKSEAAGKSMAFEKSKGIIKVFIMTAMLVGGTLFFCFLGYNETKVWAIIGFIITLAVAQMLIQIVFELDIKAIKAGIKSAVISVAAAVLIFAVFEFGGQYYDKYEINWEQMDYAAVNFEEAINYSYSEGEYDIKSQKYVSREEYIFKHMKISDKELMKNFTKACIDSQNEWNDMQNESENTRLCTYISTKYTLKNGKTVYRNYQVSYDVLKTYMLQFLENQEYRQANAKVFNIDVKDVNRIKYNDEWSDYGPEYLNMTAQEIQEFIETYKEEYANAKVKDLNEQSPVISLVLEVDRTQYGVPYNKWDIATIVVYPSFDKTIATLKEKGVKISTLEDLNVTEVTVYCNFLNNKWLDENIEVTYTDPKKIQELKKCMCLGEFGYFTAFDGDYSARSYYSVSIKAEEKDRGVSIQSATFVKSIPEWLKDDIKNKQIEQEVETTK